MNELIVLLATVPAILALVTIAKDLGLPNRAAPLLAVFLGVILSLFDMLASGLELTLTGLLTTVGSGVILGLSASGLYDGARLIGKTRSEPARRGDHAANESGPEYPNTLFKL